MNADLERHLKELGPGYREMVDMLVEAHMPVRTVETRPRRSRWWFAGSWLMAASLAAAVGIFALFAVSGPGKAVSHRSEYALAYRGSESAVGEIVRNQRLDGSWATDFLTRQNAAVLRRIPSGRVAYKKALRYLRSKGLSPMSEEELSSLDPELS
jgi:hypothetical protein